MNNSGQRGGLNPITKIALNIVGTISVLLAIAGIFLPLVPTTPFLLLASACYLRGSKRLHGWLMRNRLLAQYITGFQQGRGIPLRAKIITIALLWGSILFSLYKVDALAVQSILVVVGLAISTLVLRFKTFKEQG